MKSVRQSGRHGNKDAKLRSKRTYRGRYDQAPRSSPRYAAASASPPPVAPLVPPTAQQLQNAPLLVFTRWNETAMEALRSGDHDSCRRILSTLLPILEARLHAMQCKPSPHISEVALQSWRLAHALTLNNHGCQLRRYGLTTEALQAFLRAKEIETLVLGKPSCSTMLNLSAVLLSSGAAEEALTISKECVMAAQNGDPILFITAVHNLAVALGQQTSDRECKAALPTMLQALREAQSVLGEEHPTTVMLKEKCGLTSSWISQDSGAEGEQGSAASVRGVDWPANHSVSCENPTSPSLLPTSMMAQEKARAALHTLDFGEPLHAQPLVHAAAALPTPELVHNHTNVRKEEAYGVSISRHSLNLGASNEHHAAKATPEDEDLLCPQRPRSTLLDSVADAGVERAALAVTARGETALALPLQGFQRRGSVAASVHQLCLDSANLSGNQRSVASTPLETVLQEPFQAASLMLSRSAPNHVGPAGSIHRLWRRSAEDHRNAPSFLRFSVPLPPLPANAASLPLRKIAPPAAAAGSSNAGVQCRCTKVRRATVPRNVSVSDEDSNLGGTTATTLTDTMATTEGLNAFDTGEKSATAIGSPATLRSAPQLSLFGKKGLLHSGKAALREVELEEERVYRAQKEVEQRAAEAENAFQCGFKEVQLRTQNRAALTIQHAWQQWWTSVGRSRRHVQLKRLEELQRRRRERLSLGAMDRKKSGKSWTVAIPPPLLQQHGHVGGHVVPAVIVRCSRTWLAKTVCRRYVAKSHPRPVDTRLHEADVRRYVCQIQALWRGAITRHRQAQQQLFTERNNVRGVTTVYRLRAETELREYSALVLQMAYRSYRARQIRCRLYFERYNEPAATIQRWLRSTLADQRKRGVDWRSMCERNAAATAIQRVWRGYLGRITFHMRELRLRMDRTGSYPLAIEASVNAERRLVAIRGGKSRDVKRLSVETMKPPQDAAMKMEGPLPPVREVDTLVAETTAFESKRRSALTEAYAANCLQRSSEVQRLRDEERDRYHIGLYVDVMASKERQAWKESLRIRPSKVLRCRAAMDARIHEEQRAFTEQRAALVIQHAYRTWWKMQQDTSRDTSLLCYARALYQQRELGALVERKQRRRDIVRGMALYGDTAAAMRQARVKAAEELALVADYDGPPCISSSPNRIMIVPRKDGMMIAPHAERMARKQQRQEQEAVQRRDEVLVALTYPHDMAHVREGPVECVTRIGTTYEHPYYISYVNEMHRRTLGID
ncbi:hypothetical_protein [Leishmania braziliensis MHOM/BR/75/M2904]|nr:hypothetical_protein [Leishmania braziliensis MHOM/BR/75/M2904]